MHSNPQGRFCNQQGHLGCVLLPRCHLARSTGTLGCTERLRPQTEGTPFRLQTAFAAFANVHGVVWHLQTSQKNKDFFVCKFVCKFVRPKNSPKKGAYGTPDSHVVPHRSTDEACSGLTAQFGRDTVRFTEYGRRHPPQPIHAYVYRCVPRYFHFNRRRARRRRRDLDVSL